MWLSLIYESTFVSNICRVAYIVLYAISTQSIGIFLFWLPTSVCTFVLLRFLCNSLVCCPLFFSQQPPNFILQASKQDHAKLLLLILLWWMDVCTLSINLLEFLPLNGGSGGEVLKGKYLHESWRPCHKMYRQMACLNYESWDVPWHDQYAWKVCHTLHTWNCDHLCAQPSVCWVHLLLWNSWGKWNRCVVCHL